MQSSEIKLKMYGEEVAESVRIQYGGSVKPDNIATYMAEKILMVL